MPAQSVLLTVSAPRTDLFEGLQIVGKAVNNKSTLPILSHVLLNQDAETGAVAVTGTDLSLWIQHTLPRSQEGLAVLGTGGAATAPSKNITELLAAMADMPVELRAELGDNGAHTLFLRCNRANYKILGLPADEFPLLPEVTQTSGFTITRGELREAIRETIFAASLDDSRVILTGILFILADNNLKLVSTDTHRLAVRSCDLLGSSGTAVQAVIPARALTEIQRILGGDDNGVVSVTLSASQAKFETGDDQTGAKTTLITRLIEGQFPSYERVIPQSFDRRLTIERETFLSAIKRASIVARDGGQNRVILRADVGDDTKLTVEARGDMGDAFEEVEIARNADEPKVEIAFNARYLIDVLSVIDSPGVILEMTESLRPGIIRPTENENYFCVLMPMQVV